MSHSPRWVFRAVLGGFLLHVVLTVLFWIRTPLGFWGAGYIALLLELLPVLALAQLPMVDDEEVLPRIPVYLSSGLVILGIGAGGVLFGWGFLGFEAMGLGRITWGVLWAWTLGLTSAALALLWVFLLIRRLAGVKESRMVARLLPETRREKAAFVFLSLAAGLGEELAYRGYLIPALTLFLGWDWGAAILSSALFGVLHAYQGWLGVFRTAALGFLLASAFILSGTLWPAILAHAILDLLAGLVLGETLMKD